MELIKKYGLEVLKSRNFRREKKFIQHGNVSTYEHSVRVANMSVRLAKALRIKADMRSLVRGALLHDYFLYDWHISKTGTRLHGFSHAQTALSNAKRDFEINAVEGDIIARHMFPLNIRPPKYKESWLVCAADKLCAAEETVYTFSRVIRHKRKIFK